MVQSVVMAAAVTGGRSDLDVAALAGVERRWVMPKPRATRTAITETGSQGFRLKRVRSSLGLRRMAKSVVRPARRVGTSAAPALTKMGTTARWVESTVKRSLTLVLRRV